MEDFYENIQTNETVNNSKIRNMFGGNISRSEQKIGNTTYIVTCMYSGNEQLTDKVRRLIFNNCGVNC